MKRLALLLGLTLAAAPARSQGVQAFGKPLRGLQPGSLAAILASPQHGQEVRLEGTIAKVCQNRGCWLELKQGARSVHVTFEGYSFFVPKDSAGRQVALEGRVKVQAPDPEHARHLEAEGATAASGRVSIEATGVEIRAPK